MIPFLLGRFFKKRKLKISLFVGFVVKKFKKFKTDCIEVKKKLKDLRTTNMNLAMLHMDNNNISDAIFRFKLINIFFDKGNFKSYYNLARCYFIKGDLDKSLKCLNTAKKLSGDNVEISYFLKKIESPEQVSRIPLSFVKSHSKKILDYRTDLFIDSEFVVNRIMLNVKVSNPKLSILELGSGFGNLGNFFKNNNFVKEIIGVDISKEMLDEAHKVKKANNYVYDELIEIDAIEYVNNLKRKFDIVVVQGVLDYLRNIEDFFEKMLKGINKEGLFCCLFPVLDTEELEKNNTYFDINKDVFFHSNSYITKSLEKFGFKVIETKNIKITDEISGILLISIVPSKSIGSKKIINVGVSGHNDSNEIISNSESKSSSKVKTSGNKEKKKPAKSKVLSSKGKETSKVKASSSEVVSKPAKSKVSSNKSKTSKVKTSSGKSIKKSAEPKSPIVDSKKPS